MNGESCIECGLTPSYSLAKGLCKTCYSRQRRLRLGMIPRVYWGRYTTCRECGGAPIKARGLCNRCYDHWLEQRHPERRKGQKYIVNQKRHFGGRRAALLESTGGYEVCGMTDEQSLDRWGRKLDIHHEDGNGRQSEAPNHSDNNLHVMCCSCHHALHEAQKRTARRAG